MILAKRGSKDDYVAATSQFSQKLAVDGKSKMKYNGLVLDVSEWPVPQYLCTIRTVCFLTYPFVPLFLCLFVGGRVCLEVQCGL